MHSWTSSLKGSKVHNAGEFSPKRDVTQINISNQLSETSLPSLIKHTEVITMHGVGAERLQLFQNIQH